MNFYITALSKQQSFGSQELSQLQLDKDEVKIYAPGPVLITVKLASFTHYSRVNSQVLYSLKDKHILPCTY